MKKFLFIFLLSSSIYLFGQTPSALVNNKGIKNEGISANNPWLGGQVGYKFGGTGEFADNLIASARLMYKIELGTVKFQLPVMGNFSQLKDNISGNLQTDVENEARLQDILTSTQGLNIGLYPYYTITEKEYFSVIAHGVLMYKVNAFKDTTENSLYLNQGRISLGAEFHLGKKNIAEGRYPITLSIAPTMTFFDKSDYNKVFGEEKSSISSLEITTVVPIGKGIGVLFEGVISSTSTFRTGLLFSSQLN